MPAHNETIAAVVPASTANDHGAANFQSFQAVSDTTAGILHQEEAGDGELLDGQSIDASSLIARQPLGRKHDRISIANPSLSFAVVL